MPVIIEHKSGFTLGAEETLVVATLKAQQRPYHLAALSQVQRGRIDTRQASLVVGNLDFIKAALHQRQLPMPAENCYPDCLAPFLHRRIWQTSLERAVEHVLYRGPLFIKPALRAKRFTGLVLRESNDWRIQGIPRGEPVWCSELVEWRSEWRFYIVHGGIGYCACYAGDLAVLPDASVVSQAIDALMVKPDVLRNLVIDFGVLVSGETALVEVNNAFSVGAYGDMPGSTYLGMLQAR